MDNKSHSRSRFGVDGVRSQGSSRPRRFSRDTARARRRSGAVGGKNNAPDASMNFGKPSLLNTTLPNPQYGHGQGPRENSTRPYKKKRSKKRIILLSFLCALLIIFGSGGWYISRLIGSVDKVFHGNIISDAHALFSTTKLKGESSGRVNILLAGYQGKQSDEGPLTDSIMIVSLDTKNHTAFTMSIPRDLWVDIPGMGHAKINAANTNTKFSQAGYFHGGMGQLQQVIEQDFGIPLNYYALIDYTAFKDAVNAVGGITINIQSPDPRGLYDPNVDKAHGGPVKLPNGPATLNGTQALALALARGDSPYAYGFPRSDINRTQHQRQMLIALAKKASSAGVLGNPLRVTKLFDALGSNVRTDFSLGDVLRLAQLTKQMNLSKMQSYGLSYGGKTALLTTYTAPDGEDALIPKAGLGNYSQIQHLYMQLTSHNPVVKEDASVVILNASNVNNLAHREASILESKGLTVASIGNTSTTYTDTMIVDNSNGNDPASKQLLKKMFPGTVVSAPAGSYEAEQAARYSTDFVVILGQNWANSATSTIH